MDKISSKKVANFFWLTIITACSIALSLSENIHQTFNPSIVSIIKTILMIEILFLYFSAIKIIANHIFLITRKYPPKKIKKNTLKNMIITSSVSYTLYLIISFSFAPTAWTIILDILNTIGIIVILNFIKNNFYKITII